MGWVGVRAARRRGVAQSPGEVPRSGRCRWPRTVPAAALRGVELIHLGGGESLPCPGAEVLPLDPAVRRSGLGTTRLALPPARVHVLSGATVRPRSRVVTAPDGRIVSESVMTAMVGRVLLDEAELRAHPERIDGTVAVFRSPMRSTYHTLIDDLPRAGLLIHPALARLGPITLLHDGPLSDLESGLLAHLGSRRVTLREVEPGRPVTADRVVLPGYVTRWGAGAVPSWYRRWSDGVPLPEVVHAPRRVFLDDTGAGMAGTTDTALAGTEPLREVLERHAIERLDVGSTDALELLGTLREAELIMGSARAGLSGCLFSRRAHVVELLDGVMLDPATYYLAASKGLPYDFVPARSGSTTPSGAAEADLDWLERLLARIA